MWKKTYTSSDPINKKQFKKLFAVYVFSRTFHISHSALNYSSIYHTCFILHFSFNHQIPCIFLFVPFGHYPSAFPSFPYTLQWSLDICFSICVPILSYPRYSFSKGIVFHHLAVSPSFQQPQKVRKIEGVELCYLFSS